jgi:hypothetical protein
MEIENIVPWGRSLREYKEMFALTKEEINGKKILGCADGPSSFNTEAEYEGGEVVSIDPLYAYSRKEIMQRIDEVTEEVMSQVRNNMDTFVWKSIPDVDSLQHLRTEAMMEFLMDYDEGKEEGRYIEASLPELPFEDKTFDLALSSHFLFLYSEHLDEAFHHAAIKEMMRVAQEVRIFPLLTLNNERSPYVESIMKTLEAEGYKAKIIKTDYEFQKGANEMLRITRT